ncbi:hypothetical protein [Amycolatopsis suaedae]|uniref:DUF5709 domain-containing protein n=1 Tax=Amycolatopsis suaedae TaxID=2510978 RepID=A0A4Q7J296_9PSEU|nr:hypothetical protein [Amycolatopsis suaedae]RZQ60646.1 hypothetical protein EWH70_28715 [Amycolatopsis suaedae]
MTNPTPDPDTTTAEDLDEDRLRVDPLEGGVEPPEHWSAADRFGTTANEQREGESIEQKLAEERPDTEPDEVPETPVAAAPAEALDQSIDDVTGDVEPIVPPDRVDGPRSDAAERGQSADE